ncbi:MAG: glycosyltransferase family 39 protein [Bacteroidota bacterium]
MNFIPKYFTNKAIILFFALQIAVGILYLSKLMPLRWYILGNIEVIGFFYFSHTLTKKWTQFSAKRFITKLFVYALIIRIIYVFFTYFFYTSMTGIPFEFETGDALGYHNEAVWLKDLTLNGQFVSKYLPYVNGNYSDTGYPFYLSIIYMLIDNSILIARIVKAILSAYTCVFIYKIAKNNFGEATGKIAGIIALLFPSFIYYCGIHVKETEMIFLVTLFIERADFYLSVSTLNFKTLMWILLLGISLFFFRTILGISAFFTLFTVLIFSANKWVQSSKKILVGFWIVLSLGLFLGGGMQNEISKYWEARGTNQAQSLKARSEIAQGNKLAKYGTGIVFAPFMLVAPFPTMINIETQQNQMMIHGAYYVKNVLGFFVFIALFFFYKEKIIKKHLILIAFLLVYLGILTLSKFAISERFHMPIYPVLICLAAFGVSRLNLKNSKGYTLYLVILALVIVGWNWFKIAGRE